MLFCSDRKDNQFLQGQVDMAEAIEQTNRVAIIFRFLFLLYTDCLDFVLVVWPS